MKLLIPRGACSDHYRRDRGHRDAGFAPDGRRRLRRPKLLIPIAAPRAPLPSFVITKASAVPSHCRGLFHRPCCSGKSTALHQHWHDCRSGVVFSCRLSEAIVG